MKQSKLDRTFHKIYREDSLRANNGCCVFCFEPLTYKTVTGDHAFPKSKGGSNQRHNIVAACYECNQTKGDMSEAIYRRNIKRFPTGQPHYLMAWSRRRINLATNRSVKNIIKYFGLEGL